MEDKIDEKKTSTSKKRGSVKKDLLSKSTKKLETTVTPVEEVIKKEIKQVATKTSSSKVSASTITTEKSSAKKVSTPKTTTRKTTIIKDELPVLEDDDLMDQMEEPSIAEESSEVEEKAKITLVSATSIVEGGAHDVLTKESTNIK